MEGPRSAKSNGWSKDHEELRRCSGCSQIGAIGVKPWRSPRSAMQFRRLEDRGDVKDRG
ncbi:hypothetical protein ACEW7V_02110 [Areca yellow leaf disease phytoplasma]|uniref:hypothetical protein n=1 Tax=Areca yellow leaf disease phytoplasma TaxID=927614 RepID=UPI0035B52A06